MGVMGKPEWQVRMCPMTSLAVRLGGHKSEEGGCRGVSEVECREADVWGR